MRASRPRAAEATNAKLYGDDDPLATAGFSDKVALLQEIDAFARARDPRVVQVPPRWPASGGSSRSCAPTAG
jgi:hypothetical protein